jgi:hypothetical protein
MFMGRETVIDATAVPVAGNGLQTGCPQVL